MKKLDKSAREEYYAEVADALIKEIEAGTATWQVPWKPGDSKLPENMLTRKPYKGLNTMWLATMANKIGYADHRWGTFKQIKQLGGAVKKFEKGVRILFWSNANRKVMKDENGNVVKNKYGNTRYVYGERAFPVCRAYHVFNMAQTKGVELPEIVDQSVPWQPVKQCEELINKSGAVVEHQHGTRCYYEGGRDMIITPLPSQYHSKEGFYGSILHEMGHWTGHRDRMDREDLMVGMQRGCDSIEYKREELRAEISALMTAQALGIPFDPKSSASYVQGWASKLDNYKQEVLHACRDAQEISDYLMDYLKEPEEVVDGSQVELFQT